MGSDALESISPVFLFSSPPPSPEVGDGSIRLPSLALVTWHMATWEIPKAYLAYLLLLVCIVTMNYTHSVGVVMDESGCRILTRCFLLHIGELHT